jgi:hypothetical protein
VLKHRYPFSELAMQRGQKTLLMSVFDGNMVRNILRTDVLTLLVESPELNKIVVLCHPSKVNLYREEFKNEKLVFEAYPSTIPKFSDIIAGFIIRHIIHTNNVRAKIDELRDRAAGSYLARLCKYFIALIIFYTSQVSLIDRLYRACAIWLYDDRPFESVLRRHTPDLVFLPTIFGNNDIRLLKRCTRLGVKNVGMIKSWDNLLGKDALLIWPDRLIVHNEIVKGYATSMYGFPTSRIFISGIPQFDIYAHLDKLPSKEAFLESMQLDPAKKLLVYSCMGRWISLHELEIVRLLAEIVQTPGKLSVPSQLLVRLHPAYPSEDVLMGTIPGIRVVRPGMVDKDRNPERFDFEFHQKDTIELMATLKYADVLMNSGSTMTIDAACFDTPIINIAFDGKMGKDVFVRSAERLLKKDHYLPILATGGVSVAHTEEELIAQIDEYVCNRQKNHGGRQRIVDEQCFRMDGQSGSRIAHFILDVIKSH